MLDDECLKPGHGSDESFLSRLNTTCSHHPHFSAVGDNSSPAHCFRYVQKLRMLSPLCCLIRQFFLKREEYIESLTLTAEKVSGAAMKNDVCDAPQVATLCRRCDV